MMVVKHVDTSRLRQLCSLAIPSQVLAPQICHEVRQLISADRVHLAWSDRLGNIVDGYFEKPDAAALDYFTHHSDQFQEDAGLSYRHALLFGKETGNFRWPFKEGFESTDSHRALFGNLGLRHCIDGVIRDHQGPLGQIFLLRKTDDPDFSDFEERQLARMLPHIAHAMSNSQLLPDAFVESGDSGLIVFDAEGDVTHLSRKAEELCFYALENERAPQSWSDKYDRVHVKDAFRRLFRRVSAELDTAALVGEPPSWRVSNAWGQFQIRAYAMTDSAQRRAYGVLLERLTPNRLRILQRVKELQLSNRQMEVCFLLGMGIETAKIASMLQMAPSTLKDHARAIYQRLGVANRKELSQLLLREPTTSA